MGDAQNFHAVVLFASRNTTKAALIYVSRRKRTFCSRPVVNQTLFLSFILFILPKLGRLVKTNSVGSLTQVMVFKPKLSIWL